MVNKRKRDDSDLDEITPGRQILPVANLPYDFDQEPQDGMQYLFLVRRDAHRLPHVTRVRNPYEVSETEATPTCTPLSTNDLPCEEWRIAFQTHFSNLRKNLTQATTHIDHNHPGSGRRAIPEKKDRDGWWKFLAGYPESAWSPRARKKSNKSEHTRAFADPAEDVHPGNVAIVPEVRPKNEEEGVARVSPPKITPSYLREIDHRISIHLLMYFTHWINIHLQDPSDPLTTVSVGHGQWIFALLAKVEDQLSADEMNLLRNLARACLGLIHKYKGDRGRKTAALEGISRPALTESTSDMSDASCWMIFAAVAGHWGQRDLWADAETTLASG